MLEIKFRAYHKKEKLFYCFDLETCTLTIRVVFYHPITGEMYCELDDPNLYFEKRLYTGRKDKDGVEIYEGDIVKFIEHSHKRKGQVVFDETHGCWSVRFQFGKLDPLTIMMMSQGLDSYEVIGNIYESRELLKQDV